MARPGGNPSTQFKPGQSGNPSGRPAGLRALRSEFGPRLREYILRLDEWSKERDRIGIEAMRMLVAYLIGPPNALTPSEEAEVELTPEQARPELERVLKLVREELDGRRGTDKR